MPSEHLTAPSILFTLRLWPEGPGAGTDAAIGCEPGLPCAWHGQVTHVLSGEVRWFRDWPELIDFLGQIVGASTAVPGENVS